MVCMCVNVARCVWRSLFVATLGKTTPPPDRDRLDWLASIRTGTGSKSNKVDRFAHIDFEPHTSMKGFFFLFETSRLQTCKPKAEAFSVWVGDRVS